MCVCGSGPFFGWLVGPSSLEQVEVDVVDPSTGAVSKRSQKSMVYIHKCRYLEASNCTGMCVNMCKKPTETFFKETFGLPLYMEPEFSDGSCKMVFGQEPPPEEEVWGERELSDYRIIDPTSYLSIYLLILLLVDPHFLG